jgi:hypothetical protein
MNIKKASKNAIENREGTTVVVCPICNAQRKNFLVVKGGKKQMYYECGCGMTNKAGMAV